MGGLLSVPTQRHPRHASQYAAKGASRDEGRITTITIDKCGLTPGTCEGSLTLAPAGGGQEITLAIKPRTRLIRGEQDMIIEDLSVGHEVKVEAEQLPGQLLMHQLYLYRGFGP